ncbi:cell wall elongation regulator TseB-like domain-containing protein [Chengkuizengella marina]|uniref:Cell wall elongation regulator TseB-like domain-containing protein n=1 Tax=Chengkuizengella marina TaxID=2507566 RepID=A0A6N9Q776_9BACL|nr:DUF5590 domain-containing protein [Chengkuizengella marina]NBI30513.1 hypothetical protein [Chengkuizengella marina]
MVREYERNLKKQKVIKYSVLIFLFLIILFICFRWYYLIIQSPHRAELKKAITRAYAETNLIEVIDTDTFVGDEVYTIIYGLNDEEQNIIVWLSENYIHTELASDGISKDQVKERIFSDKPDVELLRVTPAKWTDEWAWEVFYKRDEEKGTRHYYDFYRFEDGEWLETYTMSVMR